MAGKNPYIDSAETPLPSKPYEIVFQLGDEERLVEVDPAKLPYSHEGLPGSILDIACGNGIDIDHACGGVCACSTCHVIVESGGDSCNESTDAEEDMLDLAPGLTDKSRLGCQAVPDGSKPVLVRVPSWNRNAVSEGH
ncbi:MAG: hypothetical protein DHS20C15_05900 [Planctomycetota bacterium]|nr:MAG: hypothetical protein DHS20C15_05900 [Planctomycetota bacterium]